MVSPQVTTTRVVMRDGVNLAVESRHESGSPTVVFAHGFGQTRAAWRATAEALASAGCRCVSFDARGHGESDWLPGGGYQMQQFIDDLRTLVQAQPQAPVLVGASMGGLIGLALAGMGTSDEGKILCALVLVDITPRWESAGIERILAFMSGHQDGFADYAEAAEQIAHYLPQRHERKSEAQLRSLLRAGADGRLRWHWDPALLHDLIRQGERYQPLLLEAAERVRIPVLLLSGGRSDVVSTDTINEFMRLVPHAQHVRLPSATHMVASDANAAFTQEVARFVHQLDGAPHCSAAIA